MIEIEIKSRFTGGIIFKYSKENNTILETLSGAYLSGADLRNADLSGAVKIPIHCKWTHGITENKIHIGCEKRTVEDWEIFFNSDNEIQTKRGTDEFKQIQAVFESYKAYLNFLK